MSAPAPRRGRLQTTASQGATVATVVAIALVALVAGESPDPVTSWRLWVAVLTMLAAAYLWATHGETVADRLITATALLQLVAGQPWCPKGDKAGLRRLAVLLGRRKDLPGFLRPRRERTALGRPLRAVGEEAQAG